MQSVIICCGDRGRCVVFGECEQEPVSGQSITLHNARMVLYWPSACKGLFGLAANGPKDGLRLTSAVAKTQTDDVKQWLSVSDDIAQRMQQWEPAQ